MLKRPGFIIIWPFHLDSSRTRRLGRRLPVARAVKQPSLKEVANAATALGYSPEAREKAALPSSPWEKAGYVLVKKREARPLVLKAIAGEIVRTRQKEAQDLEPKKR